MLVGLIAIAAAALFWLYRWISDRLDYFNRLGVSGPKPRFYYGNSKELHRIDYNGALQLREWTKVYGSRYGVYEGTNPVIVLANAEDVNEVCVTKAERFEAKKLLHLASDENGQDERVHMAEALGWRWKRLRGAANPLFTPSNLDKFTSMGKSMVLKKCTFRFYQEYTFDVICRLVVGQKESRMFSNPMCRHMKGIFVRDLNLWYLDLNLSFPALSPYLRKLFNTLAAKFENPIGMVLKEMEKVVDERIRGENKEDNDDFIDAFLHQSTEEVEGESNKSSKSLTRDEIIAQCFLFMMAGFDTSASAMSFVTYLLAMHPEVQEKVRDEIQAVMSEDSDWSRLGQLPYLDAVIKETLRIYPLSAFTTGRRYTRDTVVGGISIARGTYVQPDVYSIHYDERFWGADAREFRPERWLSSSVPSSAFLSFGLGPRRCIGYKLAMMETKMALVSLLRAFRVVRTERTEKELSFLGSTTFSPASVTVQLASLQDN
ncbi:hypothetical protein PRIPAC_94506 [Pristionchus pacificus]|uniref:Cytochrome P450 n=1 Tax=Pristionchus pacificus TaxID=54126 RepID=A0A2A6BAX7_PRIPA|nr:hypothetical protein PRIPAC_94506 [Pristionchus pacificus]|eukprot:PDM63030.1 cytochrome P450 [Pristionchus pacificus]